MNLSLKYINVRATGSDATGSDATGSDATGPDGGACDGIFIILLRIVRSVMFGNIFFCFRISNAIVY
jgi:hypothetical protein